MPDYKSWCPDDGGEEKADDCIGYRDAKAAALDHARDRWKRAGEPYTQLVLVREPEGELRQFLVMVDPKPVFIVSELKETP